jgi:Tfp pilus assembly protein PilF
MEEAAEALRAAVKSDPHLAAAAFNLGVLLGKARIDEAVQWCRKASELQPDNGKYARTLAFFLCEKGETDQAMIVLRDLIGRQKAGLDAYLLLGKLYEEKGDKNEAAAVYRQALGLPGLPPEVRSRLQAKVEILARPQQEKKD